MTQEEKKEMCRLIQKFCQEEGWKMYSQHIRIPRDEYDHDLHHIEGVEAGDFMYANRIILEPPISSYE